MDPFTNMAILAWLLWPLPLDGVTMRMQQICPSNNPQIEYACRVPMIDAGLPNLELPATVDVVPTPRPDNRIVEETKRDRL